MPKLFTKACHQLYIALFTFSTIAAITLAFYSKNSLNFFTKANSNKSKIVAITTDNSTNEPIRTATSDNIELKPMEEIKDIKDSYLKINEVKFDPKVTTIIDNNTKYYFSIPLVYFKGIKKLNFINSDNKAYPLDTLDLAQGFVSKEQLKQTEDAIGVSSTDITAPQISYPENNMSVEFPLSITWQRVDGAAAYTIWFGSEIGKNDLYSKSFTPKDLTTYTFEEASFSKKPVKSGIIYVRIWTNNNTGVWKSTDYTYILK
jgi:hypothetical protein